MSEASLKVCSVCGRDCSTRPRTKDRAGQYVCKECLDAAAEAKAANERAKHKIEVKRVRADELAPDADNSLVLSLGDPADAPRCPACGVAIKEQSVVLCTNCGYDFRSGERRGIKIKRRRA